MRVDVTFHGCAVIDLLKTFIEHAQHVTENVIHVISRFLGDVGVDFDKIQVADQ